MRKYKIGIIGLGMVGTPLKKYFEKQGLKREKSLFCFDVDSKKGYNDDIDKAEIIFVCLPTPRKPNGSCDISLIDSVVKKFHNKKKVLVIKSTIEPGTVARLQKKYDCPILFNPEFLTESRAWEDFIKPDRQIIGYTDKSISHSANVLGLLPQGFFTSPGSLGTYDFVRLTSSEAEMGKYAGNVFGAMKVTYGNILADFCEALEEVLKKEKIKQRVDYNHVRKALAHDSRIGDAWLNVNYGKYRGFGGYCFPKDTAAFIAFGKKLEKKLDKNDPNKKLVKKGINFLQALWDYNEALLESQGLSIKKVSAHDCEFSAKIKKIKKVKK